ncbi:restriction endonuclease subunit S [bacterium]|nr:restriction endonuclease subunit S [bacterium]
MNPQTFLKEFSAIANAPGGVPRMREMILQLAVMGKLVEQNPDDEPASELLNKVKIEIENLEKSGFRKKREALPDIKSSEIRYTAPLGWYWTRLGAIGSWKSGSTPSRTNTVYYNGEIPWVKSGEVKQGRIRSTEEKITQQALDNCPLSLNPVGSVLVAMYGANIGDVGILEIAATTNQAVCACTAHSIVKPNYLVILLKAMKPNFIKLGAGAAQPNISRIKIVNSAFPLPPLEEQKRIVAKVDQLMALCDQLEAQQQKRSKLVKNTRVSALEDLANAQAGKELQIAWKRVKENLPKLFEAPEDVEDLKKCILQNAVMGKLVPQDPNDEPASELLQKIAKEKVELIRKKKIKKDKPLPEIKDDEKPFKLPKGWEWCRLGDFGYILGGGTPSKANASYWNGHIPWVSPKDMKVEYLSITQNKISNEALLNSSVKPIPKNSILFVVRGMILAHSFPVAVATTEVTINQDMKALCPYLPSIHEFLLIISKGYKSQFLNLIERSSHGTCRLETEKLFFKVVGTPPSAEQKRIVEKTHSLLSYCDTLQKQLQKSRKIAEQLAQAIVESITGITTEKQEKMKAPKTELVTKLKLVNKPDISDHAPLSALLVKNNDELSAKALWNHSGLPIDEFYRQLKIEMIKGWIEEPQKAAVRIIEEKVKLS